MLCITNQRRVVQNRRVSNRDPLEEKQNHCRGAVLRDFNRKPILKLLSKILLNVLINQVFVEH